MSDISNPIIENASQGNLVELSHRNEQTHLQIRTLNEMVVNLRKENAKLKNNNNYLHEMLSESRQANEYLHTELKRHKSILRTRPNAMTALYDENAKLWELVLGYVKIANYFCEREGYCSRDFVAQCRYYRTQQCRLGELNDKLHELRIKVDGYAD